MIASFFLFINEAQAQNGKKNCMPQEGYWVVETNIKTSKLYTVWFYTPENILVCKQSFEGKKLRLNRPKTVKQLNVVLHQSIVAWKEDLQRNPTLVRIR